MNRSTISNHVKQLLSTVSVVVSTKNSLESLAVSIPKWLEIPIMELVIVDGGSADLTADLLNEVSTTDSRLIVEVEQRPGLALARSIGTKKSTGGIVLHAGPDNIVPVGTLQAMIEELDNSDLVSCVTKPAAPSENRWAKAVAVAKTRLSSQANLSIVGTPYVAKRDLFTDFPFDIRVKHADDTLLCEALTAAGKKISRVPEHCLEIGFDTRKNLHSRYDRWGHSDAEYYSEFSRQLGLASRWKSFLRPLWIEIFGPWRHARKSEYLRSLPLLVVFGVWRMAGFLKSLIQLDRKVSST